MSSKETAPVVLSFFQEEHLSNLLKRRPARPNEDNTTTVSFVPSSTNCSPLFICLLPSLSIFFLSILAHICRLLCVCVRDRAIKECTH